MIDISSLYSGYFAIILFFLTINCILIMYKKNCVIMDFNGIDNYDKIVMIIIIIIIIKPAAMYVWCGS